ncbi:MAG: hypothetical protein WAN65_01025, partial [Candidatus Sulfotelmatobacter sp.]
MTVDKDDPFAGKLEVRREPTGAVVFLLTEPGSRVSRFLHMPLCHATTLGRALVTEAFEEILALGGTVDLEGAKKTLRDWIDEGGEVPGVESQ